VAVAATVIAMGIARLLAQATAPEALAIATKASRIAADLGNRSPSLAKRSERFVDIEAQK